MSEQRPKDRLFDDFREARGVEDDEVWASEAWLGLVMRHDVRESVADQGLRQALELVRASGESPEELFGPAREWAEQQRRAWSEDGADAFDDAPTPWRQLPTVAAVLAVPATLVLALALAVGGTWHLTWSLGTLLIPYLLALAPLVVFGVWERSAERHSTGVSILLSAASLVALAPVIAAVLWATTQHHFGRGHLAWALAVAAAYGVLGWVIDRLTPEAARTRAPRTDEAWRREVGRRLRTRGAMPEQQIRRIIDEAQSHAAAQGTSLHEEFGAPGAYAGRFAAPPLVRARRSAAAQVGMLVLYVVVAWDIFDPGESAVRRVGWGIALACLGFSALTSLWRYVRAARAAGRA